MLKNVYFYRARLLPAVITSIPMLIFFNKIISAKYSAALKNLHDVLPLITRLGLSVGIIYICVHLNRLLAKEIVQRFYFREELYMPTTTNLLWKSPYYENETKIKIRDKIQLKFDMPLLNEQEEEKDENRARKLIASAVSQIRIALKGNPLLFQHNWEYGLMRNLIGGSILAALFSIAIIYFGIQNNITDLRNIGIICLIAYSLPILFSKPIIGHFGRYYSKICYEQFLSL